MNSTPQDFLCQPVLDRFLAHCHVKSYPAKSAILRAGEINNRLFLILHGSVSVGIEDEEDGRGLIYAYLNQGDFIGEVGIFNQAKLISANIKTRCHCKLAEIPHEKLQQVLKHELSDCAADILFLIGKQLATRLLTTSRNFRDLAFMDTEGRITRTLLDLCKEPDAVTLAEGIQIKITRRELSQIVGCTREVAGRVLKELENKNIIRCYGKNILVFDPFITLAA
jgi:CRP/FNR family cyclic AMP-dependent transcriptional regulator